MASVARLSNPRSTGNRALLPRVREYCAAHPDIFHYEVEHVDQIGEAIRTIAMVSPRVVAINGGDGTVQAALTELYSGGHFGGRSEEHTSELQSLMRISYAVFCLKKKKQSINKKHILQN